MNAHMTDTPIDKHMIFSAQAGVAYDEIISTCDIFTFGYFWWGERALDWNGPGEESDYSVRCRSRYKPIFPKGMGSKPLACS